MMRNQKDGLMTAQRKNLMEMKGEEVYYNGDIVCIEYPFIFIDGEKQKLNSKEWLNLYNEYWKNSNNEGFWLMKEIEEEFRGVIA